MTFGGFYAAVRDLAGPLARQFTASSPRILMYHRFSRGKAFRRLPVDLFEEHISYLVRNFRPCSLTGLVRSLRDRGPDPRTVAITIDDGYADFLEYAYPVLHRYGVPATVFLVPTFVDGSWLWFDALHYLVHRTSVASLDVEIDGIVVRLDLLDVASRNRAWETIADACLRLDVPSRDAVVRRLQEDLRVVLPPSTTAEYKGMTWDAAKSLDTELIELGAHTLTHPVLSRCTLAEIEREVRGSKEMLETRLDRRVEAFCYPFGGPGQYDDRSVDAVRAAGYQCATTAIDGIIRGRADLLRLPRISASDTSQFRSAVNGVRTLASEWRTWQTAAS